MRSQREGDTGRACAVLRNVLEETRGLDRRAFVRALGNATAGSALL